ncbi:glycosyl transferase, group 1 [Bdellovibrio bacteriovorus W]|nr:glycosyl transferase, group 1 [Bdellovibrio bacteriovorus W]
MPFYKNAHSKMRIFNEFLFGMRIRKLFCSEFERPDTIFYSSPSIIASGGAQYLARKLNSKFVLDVRDLWPLTLIEMAGYSLKHPAIRLMQHIEIKAYKAADFVTSNWPYAIDYMATQGVAREKFAWIPNGFSQEEFDDSEELSSEFLECFPKGKFIVGYTGTLGTANALDAIIDAATFLKSKEEIAFVIVGNGRERQELLSKISERKLSNVHYLGGVRKKQVPQVLKLFDICYVGFLNISLYRFGSSLTKLPEYFASGKPILYASSSPFQPVRDANAGVTVEAENSQEIANGILKLYGLSEIERKEMGQNGVRVAHREYEYRSLAKKLESVIF